MEEQEVSHLLRTVHSEGTLKRRLGSGSTKKSYDLLRRAMYVLLHQSSVHRQLRAGYRFSLSHTLRFAHSARRAWRNLNFFSVNRFLVLEKREVREECGEGTVV